MRFSKKYVNEVMMAMVGITGLALIVSAVIMVSETKKLAAAYSESVAVPVNVPLLSGQSTLYTKDDYAATQKALQQLAGAGGSVKIEAFKDKLVISSSDIGAEAEWRRVISDALALDRSLRAQRVCGSIANACSGAALVAEIVGARQTFFIKE